MPVLCVPGLELLLADAIRDKSKAGIEGRRASEFEEVASEIEVAGSSIAIEVSFTGREAVKPVATSSAVVASTNSAVLEAWRGRDSII